MAAPNLVVAMDNIRGIARVPAVIHVCWDDGGHSEKSYHYTGQAVDFHFSDQGQSPLYELLCILSVPQIGGIGFYPQWSPRPGWHVDIRDWSADGKLYWVARDGKYQYGQDAITQALLELNSGT